MTDNGWPEYEKLILYRLNQLDAKVNHMTDEISGLNTSVTKLKAISSMWGAAGGVLATVITAALGWFHPRSN